MHKKVHVYKGKNIETKNNRIQVIIIDIIQSYYTFPWCFYLDKRVRFCGFTEYMIA